MAEERARSAVEALVDHFASCPDADDELLLVARGLYRVGVESAHADLNSSPFESGRCMENTNFSLSFLGHTASKWREHPNFIRFLENMSRHRGRVSFLLSEDVSVTTIQQLIEFEQRFSCFEARIYMSRPMFRLVIQDDRLIALQHYEGRDSVPIGDRDDAPLLILRAQDDESLFRTLVVHFKSLWHAATPVGDL